MRKDVVLKRRCKKNNEASEVKSHFGFYSLNSKKMAESIDFRQNFEEIFYLV